MKMNTTEFLINAGGVKMSAKKLCILSVFTTIALTIFVIENALPPIIPLPGIKLGLANIVTLLILQKYSYKEAALVNVSRIILGAVFTGTIVTLGYSVLGATFSLIAMTVVNKILNNKFIYITGILGGIFHNIGQIIAAVFFTSTVQVFYYLPILLISGIVAGLFTGLCVHFLLPYIKFSIT